MTTAAHPGYVYSPLIAIHAHAHARAHLPLTMVDHTSHTAIQST